MNVVVPPRPQTPAFKGLPDHPAILRLQERDQWVAWDYVWRPEKNKWDKPPINPHTRGAGSSTDAKKWGTYELALRVVVRHGLAGVGFALTPDDGMTGIDLDKCRNKDTGELDRWVAEIVGFAETYAEISPSGTGIRLFVEGKIGATFKSDDANVEVYVGGRYLTVTGQHLDGTPTDIKPAPRTLEALRARVDKARARAEREHTSVAAASDPRRSSASNSSSFWRAVNDAALGDLSRWVPTLFGSSARFFPGTGAYRITSRSLRRNLEEDLSITAGGIVDFGVADMGDRQDGKRTAIDLVAEYGSHGTAKDAAFWLCDQLGIHPEDKGWNTHSSEKTERRGTNDATAEKPAGPLVIFYGDVEPEPPPYLIENMLPQTQTAILAGQWSAGKTFIAIGLSLAVMLGLDFAGHEVKRRGSTIWLAAEGANEVDARLMAAAIHATGDDHKGKLPFCRQTHSVPALTDPEAFDALMAIVNEAKAGLAARFDGLPLALIVIDTMNSAAEFKDQSDGAEAMRVMRLGRRLSDATGALVLFVDHFGKVVETGVKGSIDKSGASDAILSAMGDRDIAGNISNRRMSTSKLRNGPSGETIPFKLVPVPINQWGTTGCAVEWQPQSISEQAASAVKPPKPDWSRTGRTFKAAMVHALLERGKEQRPFIDAKPVKAVDMQWVRKEFYARYPAETQEAKKKAFQRELSTATGKALIASREMDGADWLWLLKPEDSAEAGIT